MPFLHFEAHGFCMTILFYNFHTYFIGFSGYWKFVMSLGTRTRITTMNVNVPCKCQSGMMNQDNLDKDNTPPNSTMDTPT
jgi:hypothetical protein